MLRSRRILGSPEESTWEDIILDVIAWVSGPEREGSGSWRLVSVLLIRVGVLLPLCRLGDYRTGRLGEGG